MDFKSLREDKLKLSKEDMADMLGVDVSKIQEWEANNDIPFSKIQIISKETGMDFNKLLEYEKPQQEKFNPRDIWDEKVNYTKNIIYDYIQKALNKNDISEEHKSKYITDLQISLEKITRKPTISIVGRSDAGKSTLINSLLGMEKMPVSWTPTTSIAVYIKHIKDRPNFIKEDAWIFADSIDGKKLWDVNKLNDEDYCKKWKVAQGDISILKSFGTRQGELYYKNAGSAVVFLDSPALLNCDIVDLPGFGTETESDTTIMEQATEKTDILIYLSQANGFMRIEDITYLKENIRNLPVYEKKGENDIQPLSNLFIVASQANAVDHGNRKELGTILKKGYENFCKTLSADYWKDKEKISGYDDYSKILESRFFTYTTDIPDLCKRFNDKLKEFVELFPTIINREIKLNLKNYIKIKKCNLEAELKRYKSLIIEREKYSKLLEQIKVNEIRRAADNDEEIGKIRSLIFKLKRESNEEFVNYFSENINIDSIIKKLKIDNIKNNQEDIGFFVSKLQDEVGDKCRSILQNKSDILSEYTKKYIEHFKKSISYNFDELKIDTDFDVKNVLISKLSSDDLVRSFYNFLFGIIEPFFGGNKHIRFIATNILKSQNNITMLYCITSLRLLINNLFNEGWQKDFSEKLINSYGENNVLQEYLNGIEKYWDTTDEAFIKAADELNKKWIEYVNSLEETVKNYNLDELKNNIISIKNIKSFFENIPL